MKKALRLIDSHYILANAMMHRYSVENNESGMKSEYNEFLSYCYGVADMVPEKYYCELSDIIDDYIFTLKEYFK